MEKFRTFSDPSTGANPFVPVWANYKRSTLASCGLMLAALPLAVVRVAVCGVCDLILGLATLITLPLAFSPTLQRAVRRPFYWLGCRMILLGLGVWSVNVEVADHRRLKISQSRDSASSSSSSGFCSSSVVLSNYTGPVEVLYLAASCCPQFTVIHADGSVSLVSLFGALVHSLSFEVRPGVGTYKDLGTVLRKKSWAGPLVVFPEAMKSNGGSILLWKKAAFKDRTGTLLRTLTEDTTLVFFRYPLSGIQAYGPQHTINTFWYHLLRMCFEWSHNATVVFARPQQVTEALKTSNNSTLEEAVEALRQVQQRLYPGIRLVEVEGEKLTKFEEYYRRTQTRGYASKNE